MDSDRTDNQRVEIGGLTKKAHQHADVVLAGGGLACCLVALRLAQGGTRVLLVEGGPQICGNHTWSFHLTDLPADDLDRLAPVIAHRWPGQKVIFPRFERTLTTGYASITSDTLREAVYRSDAIEVRENCRIAELAADHVMLDDGTRLDAACIIDGRGFEPAEALKQGFQKFVGLELELDRPHGETVPTIMDASVDQQDGYRFFYVLPLSPTRVLIEDTRYSDGGDLDFDALHSDILAYAANRAWVVSKSIRSEKGVLPVTLAHDAERFWQGIAPDTAPIGLRAGLSHPTTGYSLPMAVEVANLITGLDMPLTTRDVRRAIYDYAIGRNRDHSFFRLVNRMLFEAAEPDKRYLVLQRFYSLRQPLIERFYAGRVRLDDKIRVLVGKPPVPIHRALPCVSETRALADR